MGWRFGRNHGWMISAVLKHKKLPNRHCLMLKHDFILWIEVLISLPLEYCSLAATEVELH